MLNVFVRTLHLIIVLLQCFLNFVIKSYFNFNQQKFLSFISFSTIKFRVENSPSNLIQMKYRIPVASNFSHNNL